MSALRTTITMMVLLALLLGAGFYGWSALFSDNNGDQSGHRAACVKRTVKAGQRINTSEVRVSVFNAGHIPGKAGDTLRALRRNGFRPGFAGDVNARVKTVQIWATDRHDPAVTLVAKQLQGKVTVVKKRSLPGPGINVIVADRFRGVDANAVTYIRLTKPARVCVPRKSAGGTG